MLILIEEENLIKKRYTDQQIAFALRQEECGISVDEIIRKMGISQATFYNWKNKYGGLDPSEAKRLKQLEEENCKLKQLVADLSLDKKMLQDILRSSFYLCLSPFHILCQLEIMLVPQSDHNKTLFFQH